MIFPEGRITVTGALMKIYEGPGMIADKADAMILPVRIDGAQYTPFSRLQGKVRLRWFPKITFTLLPPRKLAVDPALRGRARRQAIGLELYDLMTNLVFATTNYRRTLFEALLRSPAHPRRRQAHRRGHPPPAPQLQPPARRQLRPRPRARRAYRRRASGWACCCPIRPARRSPSSRSQSQGRVPALLNYSHRPRRHEIGLPRRGDPDHRDRAGLPDGGQAGGRGGGAGQGAAHSSISRISPRGSAGPRSSRPGAAAVGRALFLPRGIRPDDPAVVLFTSGSEGTPKGVVLSHANILANRYQLGALLDFNPRDMVFNALPIFHSFGLTGGLLLPLLAGVKTFLYPSPLHYRIVPQLAYDSNATILFGTDTFLAGYARAANAYDFYSLRYVFAGAERVREETRTAWAEKFGLRILEGYGATEMSPVIAVNTPMQFKAGTAGRFLPGIDWRLEPVPGVAEGGRLILKGPNRHAGLSAGRGARPAGAAGGRRLRHRRYRQRRCRGLRHHPRPRQALRQDRRRDGLAGRRRERDRRGSGPTSAMPWSPCPMPARASSSCW